MLMSTAAAGAQTQLIDEEVEPVAEVSELTPEELRTLDPRVVIDIERLPDEGFFAPAPEETVEKAAGAEDAAEGLAPAPGGGVLSSVTAGTCEYDQRVDNPHKSLDDGVWTASVHGWWVRTSAAGTCPTLANVDTYLQSYWCGSSGCYWVTVDIDRVDVKQGGGRGKRGNARETCATSTSVGWRAYVDVDLINWSDPSGVEYSAIRNLTCTPS